MYTTSALQTPTNLYAPGSSLQPVRRSLALFNETRLQGKLGRLAALLTRRSNSLADLNSRIEKGQVTGQHYARTRSVPISQIRGSEGRTGDFDRNFHPLSDESKQRWMSVAAARLQGIALEPVELIQVGEDYYVRDGHHRISVAQSLGERDVDAEVTVIDLAKV